MEYIIKVLKGTKKIVSGYKNGRTRVEIVHIIQKINGNNMESI